MSFQKKSIIRTDRDERQGSDVESPAQEHGSKGRRIAFRVWAGLTGLWFLALYGIASLELVVMWLPGDTILSLVGEGPALLTHRTHFLIVGILSLAFLLVMFAQLRKPERRIAQMIQLVVMVVGAGIVYAFSGTLEEWLLEEGTVLFPVLVLVLLHPNASDLIRKPSFDRGMSVLAGLAAVPWAVYAVDNARLQLLNAGGDTHAEMEHWATAALLGITVVACGFIGSSDHRGWRLPAWIASGASVTLGIHSLAFPDVVSALTPLWAVLAIVWGVVFGVALVRRSRSAGPVVDVV